MLSIFFFASEAARRHTRCLSVCPHAATYYGCVSACYFCYTGKRGASTHTHALPLMAVALLSCSEAIVLYLLDCYNLEVQKAMGLRRALGEPW